MLNNDELVAATLTAAIIHVGTPPKQAARLFFEVLEALESERMALIREDEQLKEDV